MKLQSITVNSKAKAVDIIGKLHTAKRGGYYEKFIDDNAVTRYAVIYNTRREGNR